MASTLEIIVNAKDNASGAFGNIGNALGKLALSVVEGGLLGIGSGLAGAAVVGLKFNSQIEQVTAQLNAFTKDGAKSAEILEMITKRAAETPFAFQEMATATASLLPAAKQSGEALEGLVATAEILAASNPAQGLEGAAFALREALSGDFTSIIERFNLSRNTLNQLKEEGVPAMEAIGIAMREMGLDAELVTNMAATAAGRWSTFLDTFIVLAGTITQPIFDIASQGLGDINQWLTANEPMLTNFANLMAGQVAQSMATFSTSMQTVVEQGPTFTEIFTTLGASVTPITDLFTAIENLNAATNRYAAALGLASESSNPLSAALVILQGLIDAAFAPFEGAAILINGLASGLQGAATAVNALKSAWASLSATLGNISIPSWLVPGSPTPFEMGIRGISAALREANSIGGLNAAPGRQTGTNPALSALSTAAASPVGAGQPLNINLVVDGQVLANVTLGRGAPNDAQRALGGNSPL